MTLQPIQKKDSVVLVVDDSATMRMLRREALEQANFAVEESADGHTALDRFSTLKPNFVLLDVMMPGMDGFEVCAMIQRLPEGERTPIIMVTGLDDIESITRAYEVGATDFVTKPINWVILPHRLRYMQRASLAIEELYRSKESLRAAHQALAFRVEERTAELQRSEERECVAELLNYRKDGSPFWKCLAITPVRNMKRQVTHFIGLQSDITERKEMERIKDELVSTVSHELRTLLASLRGFTELMLKRTFTPDKQREFLSIIHSESLRLTDLINDFLDLQRIAARRQTYDFEDLALPPLLREAVTVFSSGNGQHQLCIDAPDSLPLVRVDTARLRQVLTNLLSNAIKFSPQGGAVTVGARVEGDALKVWEQDQIVGIPPEAQQNLFSKFFRVDNRDTSSIGGTGLGLALVKEIVKAHSSRVWVESTIGKGSTFFFTLSLSDQNRVGDVPPQLTLSASQLDISEKLL